MAGRLWGLLCGGLVAWGALALLGAAHRYAFGPALSPFGAPDLLMQMTPAELLALVAARGLAALLGAGVASGVSGWRPAAWVGPVVVMICMLTTLLVVDMAQPFWTLLASAVLVGLVGWLIGGRPGLPRASRPQAADGISNVRSR